MHSLLSLSAALQQFGVVSLGPQKRDEIAREALYTLVKGLIDPAAKRVSETWHRSNLHFVRKVLDTWDPTWSQVTGAWQTRLKELTSVRFTVFDGHNILTYLPRTLRASMLIHSSMTYLHEPKYFWRSCSRQKLEPLTKLLLCYASANPQAGRSTTLLSMW
jgi:hypothetical protein